VLLALRDKYGPTRSFEDGQLIPEVVALTHPDLQQFFDRYVVGQEPLPLTEYLAKIGWRYADKAPAKIKAFGKLGFRYDEKKQEFLADDTKPEYNAFGLQSGDVIVAVEGKPVTLQTAEQLLRPLVEPASGAPVRLTYRRGGAAQDVSARPREFEVELQNVLEVSPAVAPAQQALRRAMLNSKG
jgi:predicted metalloprotease with PDZ domain